jgi:tetraacyldisaccharide 4'-kinase
MLAAFIRTLQRHWWRPRLTPLTALLLPLAWLVGAEAARRRAAAARTPAAALAVPVIVVGNLIVGGAGKTPTVIALVALLRGRGWTPGIVSRGHGRADAAALLLDAGMPATAATAGAFGDEPLLMHRRTGAPVAVARRRRDAALRLLAAHAEVDILIADDGLQHHALPRDVEIVVFDGRGLGNGRTLPAGPLRERARDAWPTQATDVTRLVLVNGHWPPPPALALDAPAERCWQASRALGGAVELGAWQRGEPATRSALAALRGRTLLAAAGIGDPERFFAMLEADGLRIVRLPLADHARFDPLPWPAQTAEVIVTEKDAVKLAGCALGATRVWVATLDFGLPDGLASALRVALARRRPGAAGSAS